MEEYINMSYLYTFYNGPTTYDTIIKEYKNCTDYQIKRVIDSILLSESDKVKKISDIKNNFDKNLPQIKIEALRVINEIKESSKQHSYLNQIATAFVWDNHDRVKNLIDKGLYDDMNELTDDIMMHVKTAWNTIPKMLTKENLLKIIL